MIKLEVGHVYRSRRNRPFYVFARIGNRYQVIDGIGDVDFWQENGQFRTDGQETSLDLVQLDMGTDPNCFGIELAQPIRKLQLETLIANHMEAMRPLLNEWSKLNETTQRTHPRNTEENTRS